MTGIDKLNRMTKDAISNLDKDKLKKYILLLTRKYYEAYMKKDENAFNESIEKLFLIHEEYDGEYVNLMGFIYYCLYLNGILLISENVQNDEFALKNIAKYDLIDDDGLDEELHHDIRKIFNKDRVRRRYYEKGISESLE